MKVKICGQTSAEDCRLSLDAGADYLGVVVDVPWSPRSLSVAAAQPIFDLYREKTFLLTFNKPVDDALFATINTLRPCAIQMTGQAPPEAVVAIKKSTPHLPVYKSIHLQAKGETEDVDPPIPRLLERMNDYVQAGITGFVLDTASKGMFGGTGKQSDWEVAARVVAQSPAPIFLAGGVNPENVVEAARVPGVAVVDLASGVEESKGKKSAKKLALLFANLRAAGIIAAS